jgi:hypothetical protein
VSFAALQQIIVQQYSFQRIEGDGILSKGGNWNMLQLSNIPIALGTIGLSRDLTAEPIKYAFN